MAFLIGYARCSTDQQDLRQRHRPGGTGGHRVGAGAVGRRATQRRAGRGGHGAGGRGAAGGGMTAPEEFWEQHYRANERIWSGRANAVLVSAVEELPPGRALDLGCGGRRRRGLARLPRLGRDGGGHLRDRGEPHGCGRRGGGSSGASRAARPVALAAGRAVRPGVRTVPAVASGAAPGAGAALGSGGTRRRRAAARGGARRGAALGTARHARAITPTPHETYASLELPSQAWEVLRVKTVARLTTGPDGQPGELLDGVIAVRRLR